MTCNTYQLELQVYPDRKIIEGRVTMRAIATEFITTVELDLDPRFEILETSVNGQTASYQKAEGKLLLLGSEIQSSSEFTTTVSYRGRPYEAENPPWDGGFVWTETESWRTLDRHGRSGQGLRPLLALQGSYI